MVVTTMHQGQQSSLPNCEAVQRGAKLLRLDCAAGGEQGGERRHGGVVSGGKTRQRARYKWDDRGWGGWS